MDEPHPREPRRIYEYSEDDLAAMTDAERAALMQQGRPLGDEPLTDAERWLLDDTIFDDEPPDEAAE